MTKSQRSSGTAPSTRPSVARLAEALGPVLVAGFPIQAAEVNDALSPLGYLLGWPRTQDEYLRRGNDLRRLLQDFADDDLAPAARELFGDVKPSLKELTERRRAAAERLRIDVETFHRDIEPSLLATLAYQILRQQWPDSGEKPHHKYTAVIPKLAFASVTALLALSAFTPSGALLSLSGPTILRLRLSLVIFAFAIVAATMVFAHIKKRRQQRRSAKKIKISAYPDPEFLAQCQREAVHRLANSRAAIPLLLEMMLAPSQFRMRTVESVSMEGRSIKQHVTLDFSLSDNREFLPQTIPSTNSLIANNGNVDHGTVESVREGRLGAISEVSRPPQFLYIPLILPRKGHLMDRFTISPSDGCSAISMSYKQSLRVLSLGLRFLILSALDELGCDNPDLNNSKFEGASLALLRLIARRGSIERDTAEWREIERSVDRTLGLIADLYPSGRGSELPTETLAQMRRSAMLPVRNYVLMLTHSYPVIVSLPNTDPRPRRRLEFDRVIEPRPQNTSWLRLWLGLRPNYVEIPINLAFETDSYHLEVIGPPEYYVAHQFVGCEKCDRRLRSDWRGIRYDGDKCNHAPIGLDDQCYVRVRSRVGQNYSHMYMRGLAFSRLDSRRLAARVQFSEAPPGVEERALFSAFAASVVFGVLGFILSRYPATPIPTDVPTLFLAVPGVAAAWFGFSSDADTVLRSSLTARASLVITAVLSLSGVSCYLLQHYLKWSAGFSWSLLGIHEYAWLVLIVISLLNLAIIGYVSVYRMAHYVWLSTRATTTVTGSSLIRPVHKEMSSEVLEPQRSS